jgi:hypothetical protein
MAKEASIYQAKLDSNEYAQAQKERAAAAAERISQSKWRKKQSAQDYCTYNMYLIVSHDLSDK